MKCEQVIEDIQAYLDHELTQETTHSMEQHLDSCQACRQMVEDLGGVSSMLKKWETPTPSLPTGRELLDRTLRPTNLFSRAWKWVTNLPWGLKVPALATAAVALLVCLVWVNSILFPTTSSHDPMARNQNPREFPSNGDPTRSGGNDKHPIKNGDRTFPTLPVIKAVSPEEAVTKFETAAKTGDLETITALVAEPVQPLFLDTLALFSKVTTSQRKLQEAMDTKFGSHESGIPLSEDISQSSRESLKHLASLNIDQKKGEGETLRLTLKLTKTTKNSTTVQSLAVDYTAFKKGDRWTLIPESILYRQMEVKAWQSSLKQLADAYDKVTLEIYEGKVKNTKDAQKVTQKAYDNFLKEKSGVNPFEVLW